MASGGALPTALAAALCLAAAWSAPAAPAAAAGATTALRVYLVSQGRMIAERRTVPSTTAVAGAALRALLAGPSAAERATGVGTAIPAGTRLLGVSLRSGTAFVDLSSAFAARGGGQGMRERLAEVAYTATQFPAVRAVQVLVEGQAIRTLGGSLSVPRLLSRRDYPGLVPAVLIEEPLTGDAVASPLVVRGLSDTFEAVFRLRLLDESGHVLVSRIVHASSGSGTPGQFRAVLSWPGGASSLELRAQVQSPKDGTWRTVEAERLQPTR